MVRDLTIPKTPPEQVAEAVFEGLETGKREIFPEPLAQSLAEGWHAGVVKGSEAQNAMLVQPRTLLASQTARPPMARDRPPLT